MINNKSYDTIEILKPSESLVLDILSRDSNMSTGIHIIDMKNNKSFISLGINCNI